MRNFKIGLALSGGGFRAAAFHLGTLRRLDEIGILPRLGIMSTVSGGSIVGAFYALRCKQKGTGRPGSYPAERLIGEMRPLLTGNLRQRALFGSAGRTLRTLRSALPGGSRMPLVVEEIDRTFFKDARLDELPPWLLMSATNLSTGKAWKFFHDRVGDYLTGATDRTSDILVAEAVGASAAYPGLAGPYPFQTRWEHLKSDLLDERWQRPPARRPGYVSRWRERYGKPKGKATFPLVDGGIYDNEGLNGLRSARVTHAILSCAAPPESDFSGGHWWNRALRVVGVMHARLGALTRQYAHEMTHGAHPTQTRQAMLKITRKLRHMGERSADAKTAGAEMDQHKADLLTMAERLEKLAAVGWPPRGPQFRATAQILLHRSNVARNWSADFSDDPYDIPAADRGLSATLVGEISRVRTDLDALRPEVFDLLVAQGYFLTDAYLKVGMPEIISTCALIESPRGDKARPRWDWAHGVISRANANEAATAHLLKQAAERRFFGH